jgi:hypothetical protein
MVAVLALLSAPSAQTDSATNVTAVTGLTPSMIYHYQVCGSESPANASACYDSTGAQNGTIYSPFTTSTLTPAHQTHSSWPASYMDGPLGKNEVLPAVKGHTLLSSISGGDGSNSSQTRTQITRRERDIGRNYDLIGEDCFTPDTTNGSCGLDLSSTDLGENFIHAQGAIPYIQWDPGTRNYAAVAAGRYDTAIKDSAAHWKAFGHRVMIRMWWEYNVQGTPLDTIGFVNAWRHVVTLFQQDGASNVGWVWCPNSVGNDSIPDFGNIAASYPGDAYVDWSCSDEYNWDTNTAYHGGVSGWQTPSWLFDFGPVCPPGSTTTCSTIEQDWGGRKPFFIGETGSKYDTAGVPAGHAVDPNRKRDWFLSLGSAAATMATNENGAGLIGISFFDADVISDPSDTTPSDDWRVDSNCDSAGNNCALPHTESDPNTYSGFLSMADSSQFSGGVAGGGTANIPFTPAPGVTKPPPTPTLSHVSQAHRRWREGARQAALARKRIHKRAPVGTSFSFTVNETARVSFVFTQAVSRRKVSGKCRSPTRHNHKDPRCRRTITRARLTYTANAGRHRITFRGQVNNKRLPLGAYTLTLTATNTMTHRHSHSRTLRFTIVK